MDESINERLRALEGKFYKEQVDSLLVIGALNETMKSLMRLRRFTLIFVLFQYIVTVVAAIYISNNL